MQISELRTFLAIIETGSLVKAAGQLNVTQSTVTARLKTLENEIGQTLINRQKSGASLTAAGVRLQRYASTISDLWRQARQETSLPDALSSVCNIGLDPDLWNGIGENIFEYIRIKVPQVALSVWQGNQSNLSGWLDDGLIDVSLTYWPNASQNQESTQIFEDRLILVSTDKDSPIKFDPGYVFVEAGEEFGRDHAAAYADANTSRISFGSAQLGLQYLLRSGGTAYLPERMVRTYLQRGDLFLLEDGPVFKRRAFLITNSASRAAWPWFDDCIASIGTEAGNES